MDTTHNLPDMAVDDSWGEGLGRYRGPYLVIGPPGTGKTTFLRRQVEAILDANQTIAGRLKRNPVLICSLTRTAAAEIASRVGDQINPKTVGTIHAHAYRAVGVPKVATGERLIEWNRTAGAWQLSEGIAANLDEAESERFVGTTEGDRLLAEVGLRRHRMEPVDHWPETVRAFAERWEAWKRDNELVDFDDMIATAIDTDAYPETEPGVVLVDEAQDLSALEYRLVTAWGKRAGALVIVGDPWQALYTWRGADPGLFNDPSVPRSRRKVLAQSYRVPARVHAVATEWVRHLESYEPIGYEPKTDSEGSVEVARVGSYRSPIDVVGLVRQIIGEGKSVMVQAACSYMLSPTLRVLRDEGIPFANPWRTRNGAWNPLGSPGASKLSTVERVLAFARLFAPGRQDAWSPGEVKRWTDLVKVGGVLKHGIKARLDAMSEEARGDDDKAALNNAPMNYGELVAVFADEFRDRMAREFADCPEVALEWLRDNLKANRGRSARYCIDVAIKLGLDYLKEPPRVYVGTIHSFKGAEADAVILFPDLSDSGRNAWDTGGDGKDSVVRMIYVGLTRAKERLVVTNPSTRLPYGYDVVAIVDRENARSSR
jgi:superfamily I DNA/RNA helicase